MYFDSLQAAISMDGHGAFVWSAYAITALVVVLILVRPGRRARRALRRIDSEMKRNTAASLQQEGE
jgi:heme exporter protein D